jgi:phosphate transport system substrate-binding protein
MRKILPLFLGILYLCLSQAMAKPPEINVVVPPLMLDYMVSSTKEFQKKIPKFQISISTLESVQVLKSLATNQANIGIVTHELKSSDLTEYASLKLKTLSLARDAIIPIVSFDVFMTGIRSLSLNSLEKIYKGQITNWETLGGSSQTISVFDLPTDDSARDLFHGVIFDGHKFETTGVTKTFANEKDLAGAVGLSTSAISYASMSLTNIKTRGIGLRYNGNSILFPTPENILSRDYPLTRDITIIICGNQNQATTEFLNFLVGPEGKKRIQDAKFIPLINY